MEHVDDPSPPGSSQPAVVENPAKRLSTSRRMPGDDVDIFFVDATPIVEKDARTAKDATETRPQAASGCRCSVTPEVDPKKRRNLVVCIDGTANQFGFKNTHVIELYSRLVADETQLTYYDSGIGTYVAESNIFTRIGQKIENTLDMAIALNHKKITLGAYQWLSENYVRGDRILLFGFSRGAYQVRILAGMMETVGLLRKGNNNQIPFAYQLYLAMMKVEKREKKGSKSDDTVRLCRQFKRTLCHQDVRVHFVGVWDTVSSIGTTRGPSFPETTTGMLHVCVFRHALALHELRIKFLPEYANGGSGPLPGGNVKEVWFIGSHSDIGGGNTENIDLVRFGPPLRWMLYEALEHDLRVQPFQGGWSGPEHKSSMTLVWRLFEGWPWKRLSYNGNDRTAVQRWPPHLSAGRRIQKGQLLHDSAKYYLKEHPECKAQVLQEGVWVSVGESIDSIEVEQDSYSRIVDEAIQALTHTVHIERRPPSKAFGDTLLGLLSHPVGGQSFVDSLDSPENANLLLDALRLSGEAPSKVLAPDDQSSVANSLSRVLAAYRSRPVDCNVPSSSQLAYWLRLVDNDTCGHVMRTFGTRTLAGHTSAVNAVAWSSDSRIIASGSRDCTIRLWDAETGHPVGEPLQGHTGNISSVAFSPDGSRLASGSEDETLRIWDVATQRAVGSPLTGHDNPVLSVAFSPDGKQIVSGSVHDTIRIWDAETGLAVGEPLRGHTDWVGSVAYSPDERLIASGSDDSAARIWDAATHELVRVLEGHSHYVYSVVFTPDGKRVVSGSWDKTIRVWDVESGETVLGPLRGHTYAVRAVAISPDGKYIASGSVDQTVRLWDTVTGEAVGEPLRGHIREVWSVAFSPDGRRVVSGSLDKTLMIWDVDVPDDSASRPS